MKLFSAFLAGVALLASACATSQPTEAVKLEVLPDFEVSYSGALNDKTEPEIPQYTQAESDTDVAYTLEAKILSCSAEQGEEIFGKRAQVIGAWSMPADELTLERMSKLEVVSAPRLMVFEGQNGVITIVNQVSYISGFEIEGKADQRIADPVIDVVQDGLMLGLRATSGDATHMNLQLDLTLADLVRPIKTQTVQLGGAGVTIQTPVVYIQRMKAQGKVSQDKVLVLTGMTKRDGSIYVVLITGQRMKLDDTVPDQDLPEKE